MEGRELLCGRDGDHGDDDNDGDLDAAWLCGCLAPNAEATTKSRHTGDPLRPACGRRVLGSV